MFLNTVDSIPTQTLIDGPALPGIQLEEACHITILLPVTGTPALFCLDLPSGRWGGPILNAGGFLGQKSVRATDMLIVFVEKALSASPLSSSFISSTVSSSC